MIYEARPNVTYDVFSLCFKSGNACVLKGGSDADLSNQAAIELIHEVLQQYGVNPDIATLLPATHEATGELLNAVGYVDLCIPRGGRRLIDFVRDTARIPVIETGAGVVNTYFDKEGDLEMGKAIVCNAKTRRVSVCNALNLSAYPRRTSGRPLRTRQAPARPQGDNLCRRPCLPVADGALSRHPAGARHGRIVRH